MDGILERIEIIKQVNHWFIYTNIIMKSFESKLFEISQKYNVEIEFKIKKDKTVTIINNDSEGHYIDNGFVKNNIKEVEKIAIEMFNRELEKDKNLSKDIIELSKNKELFPDDLFKNENYEKD